MSMWIDHKYAKLAAPKLERFKQKTASLYNFRCPFCGDSQKDAKKARGFLYEGKGTLWYKCHNCHISGHLRKLLEHIDPQLAKEYSLESFSNFATNRDVEFKKEEQDQNKIDDDLLILLGAKRIEDSLRAQSYLETRLIPPSKYSELLYIQNMEKLLPLNEDYKDRLPQDERILIPYRDRLGNIIAVAGRAMGHSKKRYIYMRFVSDYPLLFGVDKIDAMRDVYIVEGALDSLFLNNCIAAGGADLLRAANLFEKDKVVLIFDNEPRNKDIVKIMEKMISHDFRMVIWPKSWQYKDVNEAIIAGVAAPQIQQVIYNNTHRGLSLKLAIRDWKKCP